MAEILRTGPEVEPEMRAAGERMAGCLDRPLWGVLECACPDRTQRRLVGAIRCGDRLCPNCARLDREAWGRALVAKFGAKPGSRLVFLTLTHLSVEHLTGDDFGSLWHDFAKLRRTKLWKGVSASASSCEVTHSDVHGWHPHVHALLQVDEGEWLAHQSEWSEAWERISGAKIVDIREVDLSRKGIDSIRRELLKYVTKPASLHGPREAELTRELWRAMRGRRLVSTTGEWRGVADHQDPDQDAAELERLGLATCPKCGHRPALSLQGWVWAGTHYYRFTPDDRHLPGSRRMVFHPPPVGYARSGMVELGYLHRAIQGRPAAPVESQGIDPEEAGSWWDRSPEEWPDGSPYLPHPDLAHRSGPVPATVGTGPDRWRSTCSCGWASRGRFSTREAASRMALAHKLGKLG